MEGIMRRFLMNCARGALGLGAAALFLAGVPVQAGAASGGSLPGPAEALRASQPLLLAQNTAQQEAAQLEKRRQAEQKKEMQQKDLQLDKQERRMRGPMPKSAVPAPEAVPPQPGSKRFGAGVVRHGDDPGDSGQME
jgi:hypothetical protein